MDKTESAQIELIRIICIVSMMWVHVSPGLAVPSLVSGGSLNAVGHFLGNTLGRISVTTLSFVSGYLLWRTAANRRLRDVVRRLAISIYLPTLVWSGAFILLALAKVKLLGLGATSLDGSTGGVWGALNAWAGLTGPTANRSLFFIRDLVLSTLIVHASFPLLRRTPWLIVLIVLPLGFLETLRPLLFRPQILIFVTLGAASARAGLTIPKLSRPFIALPSGFALVITAYLLTIGFPSERLEHLTHNLMGRAGLGFFIFALTGALLAKAEEPVSLHIGRHCFLAYLSHMLVIGVLWVVWQRLIGGAQDPSYILFYLATPPLMMTLAVFWGRALDRAPVVLQILLRGKTVAVTKPDAAAIAPH